VLEDDEITVRPEIMAFAVEMEKVMAAHDDDYENSYRRMDIPQLREGLLTIHRRAAHIDDAMCGIGSPNVSELHARIPSLAARIGCYAMFFHYHYKGK
jgi:hypothetical protein